nr:uncharacterized protein LOC121124791 [Lepeophtheirus salmonis]
MLFLHPFSTILFIYLSITYGEAISEKGSLRYNDKNYFTNSRQMMEVLKNLKYPLKEFVFKCNDLKKLLPSKYKRRVNSKLNMQSVTNLYDPKKSRNLQGSDLDEIEIERLQSKENEDSINKMNQLKTLLMMLRVN